MSDTPLTDAESRRINFDNALYPSAVEAYAEMTKHSGNLEKRLAAMTAERDRLRDVKWDGILKLEAQCDTLRAELSALQSTVTPEALAQAIEKLLCYVYYRAYDRGHNDTVEGQFSDVHASDAYDFWSEDVQDLLRMPDMTALVAKLLPTEPRKDGEPPCQPIDPTGSNVAPGVPTSGAATLAQADTAFYGDIAASVGLLGDPVQFGADGLVPIATPAPRESETVPSVAESAKQIIQIVWSFVGDTGNEDVESILSQLSAAQSARIAELEADKVRMLEALKLVQSRGGLAIHQHWDDTMQGGIGCRICNQQREVLKVVIAAMNSQP